MMSEKSSSKRNEVFFVILNYHASIEAVDKFIKKPCLSL